MENIGRIEISTKVVEDIILESVSEVSEVHSIADKSQNETFSKLKNLAGMGLEKAIDVELGETDCIIDLALSVYYGVNIRESVVKFQEVVKNNVEKLTGIKVNEVNVKVASIVKKEVEENV